jgi:hypothetical protein
VLPGSATPGLAVKLSICTVSGRGVGVGPEVGDGGVAGSSVTGVEDGGALVGWPPGLSVGVDEGGVVALAVVAAGVWVGDAVAEGNGVAEAVIVASAVFPGVGSGGVRAASSQPLSPMSRRGTINSAAIRTLRLAIMLAAVLSVGWGVEIRIQSIRDGQQACGRRVTER